jgi:hypothetical protein
MASGGPGPASFGSRDACASLLTSWHLLDAFESRSPSVLLLGASEERRLFELSVNPLIISY